MLRFRFKNVFVINIGDPDEGGEGEGNDEENGKEIEIERIPSDKGQGAADDGYQEDHKEGSDTGNGKGFPEILDIGDVWYTVVR